MMNRLNQSQTPPLQSISQTTLNNLILSEPSVNLASWLTEHGYSTEIGQLNIHQPPNMHVDFSGCQFTQTSFSGYFNASTFNHVQFNKVTFDNAQLNSATFQNTTFTQTALSDSSLKGTSFVDCHFNASVVAHSDLSDSSFYKSSLTNSILANSDLTNVLDYENSSQNLHLIVKQDYQNDYAFTSASINPIIPNLAIHDEETWSDGACEALSQRGFEITHISHPFLFTNTTSTTSKINATELVQEIKNEVSNIQMFGLKEDSIIQQVLHAQSPNLKAIREMTLDYVTKSDAVLIPGGEDIIDLFYKDTNPYEYNYGFGMPIEKVVAYLKEEAAILSEEDLALQIRGIEEFEAAIFYKQMVEFGLTDAAMSLNKPIMGICHGLQSLNVYMGGTLKNVEGHDGIFPNLTIHKTEGYLGSALSEPMVGPSYHHQAIDTLGKNLEVVATYDNVIKGAQGIHNPIVMTQFHPEHEMDSVSTHIMDTFAELGYQSATKSKIIALGDVLDISNPYIDTLIEKHLPSQQAEMQHHDICPAPPIEAPIVELMPYCPIAMPEPLPEVLAI